MSQLTLARAPQFALTHVSCAEGLLSPASLTPASCRVVGLTEAVHARLMARGSPPFCCPSPGTSSSLQHNIPKARQHPKCCRLLLLLTGPLIQNTIQPSLAFASPKQIHNGKNKGILVLGFFCFFYNIHLRS